MYKENAAKINGIIVSMKNVHKYVGASNLDVLKMSQMRLSEISARRKRYANRYLCVRFISSSINIGHLRVVVADDDGGAALLLAYFLT